MTRWSTFVIAVLVLGIVSAVACGGGDDAASGGEPGSSGKQNAPDPPTPTPGGSFTLPSIRPASGIPVQPTLSATAPAVEGAIVADADRGSTLFTSEFGCSGCHSTGTDMIVGPAREGWAPARQ